ncbi:PREDICTED: NAD(P)H-quinone oxidoreductase subunit T, chloroplastic [Tarenaya hassleriana]|uniref:NAD(P)H-quinone oxidoreductase subunit T, chloroplastic n=1 Tax=Tarenaya hassleriana TaxID=28532 RepID=UPI00053C5AE1|nr:PREDICTED: NAD(P)H-quinone oxidoreductase subunit T, chloroplastic [Tarenaya hassleriana]
MASTASCHRTASIFLPGAQNSRHSRHDERAGSLLGGGRTRKKAKTARIYASKGPTERQRAPPGVDTRIHWDNPDDGWIGGPDPTKSEVEDKTTLFGDDKFSDLLMESSDSHYQFLGVNADADIEEIKAAYRRLSKEYHPDTTSLPLKTASDKFMKLREVYDVLSDEESRRFYDWTLAQEAASRQAEKMRMKLDDPKERDLRNYQSIPDMVDRLGGRNMELSDQAMTALTFDVLIIIFAICCIVYVVVFKEPNY